MPSTLKACTRIHSRCRNDQAKAARLFRSVQRRGNRDESLPRNSVRFEGGLISLRRGWQQIGGHGIPGEQRGARLGRDGHVERGPLVQKRAEDGGFRNCGWGRGNLRNNLRPILFSCLRAFQFHDRRNPELNGGLRVGYRKLMVRAAARFLNGPIARACAESDWWR